MRTASGSGSSSISRHNLPRSSSRSATRNAVITCPQRGAFLVGEVERDARPQAVDEAVGDLGREDLVAQPVGADRLFVRLAHRPWGRRRTAAAPSDWSWASSALRPRPAARAWTSTAPPQARAGSGRDSPAARRIRSSHGARPSTLRSSRPEASRISIVRTWPGSARGPPLSAIDSASVCSRLSSSTRSETSCVIRTSSELRLSSVSRPLRISRLSGILMLTSLSEQSTPALLSMKSVLIRPPFSANSIRPAWVMARLAPSPMTLALSSLASARSESLAGSPTCAWLWLDALM